MKKYFIIILAATSILSCDDPVKNTETTKKVCVSDSMVRMISIDTAKECNVDDELKLSGEVSFDENKVIKVYPIASGQVKEVKVGLGDRVKAGDELAIIRSADIAGNYNDLHSATADVVIAKTQLDNATSLYKNGISSLREYEEAKENYEKALAAENKIKQQLHINGADRTDAQGDFIVVAPRSGYILEKKINPGGFIRSDNSDNLFSIGDVGDVWIWANVYESDIAKVKEGYQAKVTTLAYPDSVFIGRVDKISQVLDPQSKVMRVRIVLPNKTMSLKPEMFANVAIENKEGHKALCIPSAAIVSDFGKNYVVVYKNQCDLAVKEIHVQKTVAGKSFLTQGLNSGDRVLSSNQVLFFRALMEQ